MRWKSGDVQIPGRQRVREQLARTPLGRVRLGIRRRDLVDRVIASDPGLTHLRLGIKVATCIASTLLLQWLLATALGQPPVLAMLLGAVVAMLLSSGVRENTRRRTILTALPGLPAALIGASLATLTAPWHTVTLVLFVGVSFVVVWVRRFGGAWVSYGMLCWQSFFFILFLDPPVRELPDILLVITASVAWVSLLLCTVLYEDPASRLLSTVNAFRARCRSAIAELISVLDAADDEHPSDPARRLRSQLVQLGEIALLHSPGGRFPKVGARTLAKHPNAGGFDDDAGGTHERWQNFASVCRLGQRSDKPPATSEPCPVSRPAARPSRPSRLPRPGGRRSSGSRRPAASCRPWPS